jgi:hypothetical protein
MLFQKQEMDQQLPEFGTEQQSFSEQQDTETNYTPAFADIQTNINYEAPAKWQWSFLGNISQNKYQYQPLTRQTNFSTIDQPCDAFCFL